MWTLHLGPRRRRHVPYAYAYQILVRLLRVARRIIISFCYLPLGGVLPFPLVIPSVARSCIAGQYCLIDRNHFRMIRTAVAALFNGACFVSYPGKKQARTFETATL